MKPASFDYYRPGTVEDALAALGTSETAKVLAGGQSLIPAMNFRLSQPDLLVDIGGVGGFDRLEIGPSGVMIGALVTQSRVMASDEAATAVPGLRRALRHVAHLQIRNRGTVCGSLAHADPAAELPALAVACGATLFLQGPAGKRTVDAGDFFLGPFWTDLAEGEIITGVHFPSEPADTVTVLDELAWRSGDFAITGLAAALTTRDGTVSGARLVSFGVGGAPSRMAGAEQAVLGFALEDDGSALYGAAYSDGLDAVDDVHASAEYRREALGALAVRSVRAALASNGNGTGV